MIEYKSRRESMMPSLLPFMAVLLCTMGALVLILILIVSDTKGTVLRELQAESEKIDESSDELQFVSGELEAVRTKQQAEIDGKRRQLAFLEDHISRLNAESVALEKTAALIQEQFQETISADNSLGKIDSLKTEITELEKKIQEDLKQEKSKPPAFAIVPYSGPNGTTRRPIYLECVADGVIVQPEGFLLDMEALRPPYGPGNPLDAVLRLLRTEYEKLDNNFATTTAPYPLLLIRPDGIRSYVYARTAMGGWDDQFGYELVSADMRLAFPKSRAGLKDELLATVKNAKERQQALLAAMPRAFRESKQWEDEPFDSLGSQEDNSVSFENSGEEKTLRTATNWEMIEELPENELNRFVKSQGELDRVRVTQAASNNSSKLESDTYNSANMASDPDVSGQQFETAGSAFQSTQSTSPGRIGYQGQAGASLANNGANGSVNDGNGSAYVDDANTQKSAATPGQSLFSSSSSQEPYMPRSMNTGPMTSVDPNQDPLTNPSLPSVQLASRETPRSSESEWSTEKNRTPRKTETSSNKSSSHSASANTRNAKSKNMPEPSEAEENTVGGQWRNLRSRQNQTPVVREVHIHVLPDKWLVAADEDFSRVEKVISLDEGPSVVGNSLMGIIDKKIESWGQAINDGYWKPKIIAHCYSPSSSSLDRLAWVLKKLNLEFEQVTDTTDVSRQ